MEARFKGGPVGRYEARRVVLLGSDALSFRAVNEDNAAVEGLFRLFRLVFVFFLISVCVSVYFFYGSWDVICLGSVATDCDGSNGRLVRVNQAIEQARFRHLFLYDVVVA